MIRLWILLGMMAFSACKRTPIERTEDASDGGAVGTFAVADDFVIFHDELSTGGGASLYDGGDNHSVAFNDRTNPISARSIRYVWNGHPTDGRAITPGVATFAGFNLMHTVEQSQFLTTPGRDLHDAAYTKAVFYARGRLSSSNVLKVEVADDGPGGATPPCLALYTDTTGAAVATGCTTSARLTEAWQRFEIPLTASALSAVKDFFKATMIFENPSVTSVDPGQGGQVYFDSIRYTH